MFRDEEYFMKKLQEDTMLYDVFFFIGEFSTIHHEIHDYVEARPAKLEDVINGIKVKLIKSDSVIQRYIDILIEYGLCHYCIDNQEATLDIDNSDDNKDAERLNYYRSLGYPKADSEIKLTDGFGMGCSGVSLFRRIVIDNESKKAEQEFSEAFSLGIEEILKPYDDKVEGLTKKLEEKIVEVNRTLDSGIIKNIQVISVFAGIISLLFANIMGIKEFSNIGTLGFLVINFSLITAIFALILFTKLLIMGEKLDSKAIIICFAIIAFIALPILLIKIKVL